MRIALIMLLVLPTLFAGEFTVAVKAWDAWAREDWTWTVFVTVDGNSTTFTGSAAPYLGAYYTTYTIPDGNCYVEGSIVYTETDYFYETITAGKLDFRYTLTPGINIVGDSAYVVLGSISYGIKINAGTCVTTTTTSTATGSANVNVPALVMGSLFLTSLLGKLKKKTTSAR